MPIPVDEYLRITYRPDCDYVDGEVLERNLGERDHASVQRRIVAYFVKHYPHLLSMLFSEQRVQVTPTRFRIPDVCLLAEDAPVEQIVRTPPILCIEILSKEDTMTRIMVRVKDYFQMGVPVCWIIDPALRSAWVATPGQLTEPADGILRAGEIEMPLTEVLEPPVALAIK
jgi:Uma2 family endonuclease